MIANGTTDPTVLAERLRIDACARLTDDHRENLGQFLTPTAVAASLASFFDSLKGNVRLLDPGAGVGALTAAFVKEAVERGEVESIHIVAVEVESAFHESLSKVLEACVQLGNASHVRVTHELRAVDFLTMAAAEGDRQNLFERGVARKDFTHTILNPPYRKIRADSPDRVLLRHTGLETSNLYTGFLWLAAKLLRNDGEMVAITPRSFCNGPYFLPFRNQFFDFMSLQKLHTFERRNSLFGGDAVLQENLVLHVRKQEHRPATVQLIHTVNDLESSTRRDVAYQEVLSDDDPQKFVHLTVNEHSAETRGLARQMRASLDEIGLTVSTGRVVDFRAREYLRMEAESGTVPLLYPSHLSNGKVVWPRKNPRKPNALMLDDATAELLVPNGRYLLIKRFTTKEEKKRIVATVFEPSAIPDVEWVGFENHLNYFHCKGAPLDEGTAKGLCIFLNSSVVDSYFRQFNGHTQVNATDLRSLRYPSLDELAALAEFYGSEPPTQDEVDAAANAVLFDAVPA